MPRLTLILFIAVLPLWFATRSGWAELFVWVDESGVTRVSDDPSVAPPTARSADEDLGELWISSQGDETVSGSHLDPSEARVALVWLDPEQGLPGLVVQLRVTRDLDP